MMEEKWKEDGVRGGGSRRKKRLDEEENEDLGI